MSLRVVLFQPGKPEDEVLLTQAGDCKCSLLHMPIYLENHIYNLSDGSTLVRRSVNIIDRDWPLEFPSGEVVSFHITPIHELSGGSTVYKGRSGLDFCSVCCLDLDFND